MLLSGAPADSAPGGALSLLHRPKGGFPAESLRPNLAPYTWGLGPLLVHHFARINYCVTRQDPGLEQVCLGPACSVWVLDFMQKRFHNTSPGDLERTFINAGGSETKKGLGQKKQQEALCLGSLENL